MPRNRKINLTWLCYVIIIIILFFSFNVSCQQVSPKYGYSASYIRCLIPCNQHYIMCIMFHVLIKYHVFGVLHMRLVFHILSASCMHVETSNEHVTSVSCIQYIEYCMISKYIKYQVWIWCVKYSVIYNKETYKYIVWYDF